MMNESTRHDLARSRYFRNWLCLQPAFEGKHRPDGLVPVLIDEYLKDVTLTHQVIPSYVERMLATELRMPFEEIVKRWITPLQ
jgi:hypothetical protein